MTKLEKILLCTTVLFFLLALPLLPRNGSTQVQARPAFTLPGPVPSPTSPPGEVWVTLRRRIDLNHADAKELELLPGVGPVTAEAIVAYRESHGLFAGPEDLLRVPEISGNVYAAIMEAIGTSPD